MLARRGYGQSMAVDVVTGALASEREAPPGLTLDGFFARPSPVPLSEAIAQRVDETEFGAALWCPALCSASWAGHPEVKA